MGRMTKNDRSYNRQSDGDGHERWDEAGSNCEIATKLRALYRSIEEEEVPNELLDLLEKLDEAETTAAKDKSDK